ncbi:MAG: 50S ribosomal protein L1 [Candidatus Babeliales bacterium]
MTKKGKRYQKAQENVVKHSILAPREAFALVKENATAKFNETISAQVNLGIDPAKGEQAVRGSVVLPHGQGKVVRILVFAKGSYEEEAVKAGADFVGTDDLIQKIQDGWLEFDVALATPDLMGVVSKVAKLLGPKGLLPSKKLGTVTFDIEKTVRDLKSGKVFFKNNKSGIVNFVLGKASFDIDQLCDNFAFFLRSLRAVKPVSSKGIFIKKIVVSSTMGVGVGMSCE